MNFGFAAFNAVLAAYAILAFMGLANSLVDIWIGIVAKLYKKPKASTPRRSGPRGSGDPAGPSSDWEAILHYGASGTATQAGTPEG